MLDWSRDYTQSLGRLERSEWTPEETAAHLAKFLTSKFVDGGFIVPTMVAIYESQKNVKAVTLWKAVGKLIGQNHEPYALAHRDTRQSIQRLLFGSKEKENEPTQKPIPTREQMLNKFKRPTTDYRQNLPVR